MNVVVLRNEQEIERAGMRRGQLPRELGTVGGNRQYQEQLEPRARPDPSTAAAPARTVQHTPESISHFRYATYFRAISSALLAHDPVRPNIHRVTAPNSCTQLAIAANSRRSAAQKHSVL